MVTLAFVYEWYFQIYTRDLCTLFLPSPVVSSSLLFHGLASLCAVDQRSIVGSDSMDDAEAAGVERGGKIVVVEPILPLSGGGQLKRK